MAHVPRRLYLAGPMSGYPEHNFPLFHSVAEQLRRHGHDVFNPAENKDGATLQPRAFYLRLDIPALLECEGLVLLPGWRASRGASLEVWLAIDLGMPIYKYVVVDGTGALERIAPPHLTTLPFEDGRQVPSLRTE